MATALVVSLLFYAGGKDAKLVTRFALPRTNRRLYFTVTTTGLASVIPAMLYSSLVVRQLGSQGSPPNISLFLCQILHKLAFVWTTAELYCRYSVN